MITRIWNAIAHSAARRLYESQKEWVVIVERSPVGERRPRVTGRYWTFRGANKHANRINDRALREQALRRALQPDHQDGSAVDVSEIPITTYAYVDRASEWRDDA